MSYTRLYAAAATFTSRRPLEGRWTDVAHRYFREMFALGVHGELTLKHDGRSISPWRGFLATNLARLQQHYVAGLDQSLHRLPRQARVGECRIPQRRGVATISAVSPRRPGVTTTPPVSWRRRVKG